MYTHFISQCPETRPLIICHLPCEVAFAVQKGWPVKIGSTVGAKRIARIFIGLMPIAQGSKGKYYVHPEEIKANLYRPLKSVRLKLQAPCIQY